MVLAWADELKRDPKLRLADLARRHGLSRARVTQLMPLASLKEETLRDTSAMSLRALLRLVA